MPTLYYTLTYIVEKYLPRGRIRIEKHTQNLMRDIASHMYQQIYYAPANWWIGEERTPKKYHTKPADF